MMAMLILLEGCSSDATPQKPATEERLNLPIRGEFHLEVYDLSGHEQMKVVTVPGIGFPTQCRIYSNIETNTSNMLCD